MSLKLERWMRALITGKWGRWVMLGLLIAILSGFTVMSEIGNWLFGKDRGSSREEIAGSFAVLPGDVTEVDYTSFEAARRQYGLAREFLQRVPRDRVPEPRARTATRDRPNSPRAGTRTAPATPTRPARRRRRQSRPARRSRRTTPREHGI